MSNRFYNYWIAAGLAGSGWMPALLFLLNAPWWMWMATGLALAAIVAGCFACMDQKQREQPKIEAVIREMMRRRSATTPRQKRK